MGVMHRSLSMSERTRRAFAASITDRGLASNRVPVPDRPGIRSMGQASSSVQRLSLRFLEFLAFFLLVRQRSPE